MVLVIALAALVIGSAAGAEDTKPVVPLGLDKHALVIPDDNPMTTEKITLGKQLYFDKRWSKDKTVSCSTCHNPQKGWSDDRQFSAGASGRLSSRHAPTVINRAFSEVQRWAGDRKSLEEQAYKASDTSPETIAQNLGTIRGYQEQFQRVFGTGVTAEGVAKAIAAYQRTILSGNSPYDRFRAGDQNALSAATKHGLALFEGKARCGKCHSGFNFTDEGYHNLGVGMDKENPDLGRYPVTKRPVNRGAFKTPTLRDVALRRPYMHDGSLRSLREVAEFYNRGGLPNPWLSPEIVPLNLSRAQQEDLLAFLESLTGQVSPDVSRPPVLPE
jgi:cytochrome c peroxidase